MKRNGRRNKMVTKRSYPTKTRGKVQLRWVLLIAILALSACVVFFAVRQHNDGKTNRSTVTIYYAKVSAWLAKRKNHVQNGIDKVKQLAVREEDGQQPVHFEFYTALPNMQIESAEQKANNEQKPDAVHTIVDAADLEKDLQLELPGDTSTNQQKRIERDLT